MSNLHCPLCGLWFHYASELDGHVREDHAPPPHLNCPPPRERRARSGSTGRDAAAPAPVVKP